MKVETKVNFMRKNDLIIVGSLAAAGLALLFVTDLSGQGMSRSHMMMASGMNGLFFILLFWLLVTSPLIMRNRSTASIGVGLLFVLVLAACGTQAAPAATVASGPTAEPAKPSNPGGPGAAVTLTGDTKAGAVVFTSNCVTCHGDQGKGGVSNPGSTDGTVPALNPIDTTLMSTDPKVYATNLDLFLEHGSTPAGDKPAKQMAPWGDSGALTQQQIADVIAYVMSLNPAK
ncbi:MAG: cytochrome c [Roseiflexaceae bacterium]